MAGPVVLGPGEGERIKPTFLLLGAHEQLVIAELTWTPGMPGPDPHVHHHHADAFYVLEGELHVGVAGEDHLLLPGAFAIVPPDVVHGFGVSGSVGARFLNFHAPGMGFDERVRSGAPFDQHPPPEDGGRPGSLAVVLEPGEGESLGFAHVKAGGGTGLGSLGVLETEVPAGFPGPLLHVHDRTIDSFYVLEGTLTVRLGDETAEAGPGSYAFIPPGHPHTFSNPGGAPARFLNVMAPGGFERYLQELAAAGGALDPPAMAEIASKYDFRAI
jgi:mannose-6-phosphate isomerase-like protein (cupin superfamily)